MATEPQKQAARRNIAMAREAQRARARGAAAPRGHEGLLSAEKNRLPDSKFAFPRERKEPLTDGAHVRNAVARFDQVEGVTDAERDQAWERIVEAAGREGVEVSAGHWKELFRGGKARKR